MSEGYNLFGLVEFRRQRGADETPRLMFNDVPPRADRGSQPFGQRRLTT